MNQCRFGEQLTVAQELTEKVNLITWSGPMIFGKRDFQRLSNDVNNKKVTQPSFLT